MSVIMVESTFFLRNQSISILNFIEITDSSLFSFFFIGIRKNKFFEFIMSIDEMFTAVFFFNIMITTQTYDSFRIRKIPKQYHKIITHCRFQYQNSLEMHVFMTRPLE